MPPRVIDRIDDETRTKMANDYEAVKVVIATTVGKFVVRYGGHFDTLLADADMAFFICSSRNQIDNIRRWVWFELLDAYRVELNGRKRVQFADPDTLVPPDKWVDGSTRYDHLSGDAQFVIELTLDPPPEVEEEAKQRGGEARILKRCSNNI